jgi:alkanesulfonate monooxygenase SsuD/methylene tetrahydromethanopterin reductase-like flavin-dependent oxidoreductase (luciferase family)
LKIYCHVMHAPTDELLPIAQRVEELGYDGIALCDHLAFPADTGARYRAPTEHHWDRLVPGTPAEFAERGAAGIPSPPGGGYDAHTEFPDAWVGIGAMAAATKTVEFITTVYVLPLRDALHAAHAIATAAVFADGRLRVGVGLGWFESEFVEVGRPFAGRGSRMEEQVEVMRKVWEGGFAEHQGRDYNFALCLHQLPRRPPRILIGGRNHRALDRVARLADGYIAPPASLEDFASLKQTVDARREAAGRGHLPFEYMALLYRKDASNQDTFARLEELGCDMVRVAPFDIYDVPWRNEASLQQRLDALERWTDEMSAVMKRRPRTGPA